MTAAAPNFLEVRGRIRAERARIASGPTDPDLDAQHHAALEASVATFRQIARAMTDPLGLRSLARLVVRRNRGRQRRPAARPRASRAARRMARTAAGGGGGDPDPGDPDPSGDLAHPGRETLNGHRFCRGCGNLIDHLRPQAVNCSDRCRMAYVRRGKVAAKPQRPQSPRYRPPRVVVEEVLALAEARQKARRSGLTADAERLTADLDRLYAEKRLSTAAAVRGLVRI